MRLFTKDIDKKLFNQYPKGADLEKQFVVGKIFNPYGRGRWYLINSDPNDPDYIWAIVQMGDIVEVGSVSRKELESIRVKPFGLPLERDLHFTGIKALDILNGLKQGKHYKAGGWVQSGVNLTNELRGEDHDDYGTFELYKNGGEVDVKIINSDESYDKSRYEWLIGDFDKDGVSNVDDKKPFTQSSRQTIDSPSISNGINKLLSMKHAMDENMYDFVDELKNISPDKSKIYARTKTPYSILDKLIKKRLSTLTDLIGTTIVTQDKKELDEVKKQIESGKLGKVLELEDMYQNPKQGYRAYHFLIEKNGMPIELQLKTKRQKALNELSHEPYKLGKLDSDKLIKMTEVANKADNGEQLAQKEYNDFMQQPDLEKVFYKYAKGGYMADGGMMNEIENWEVRKLNDGYYPYGLYLNNNLVSGLRSNREKEIESKKKEIEERLKMLNEEDELTGEREGERRAGMDDEYLAKGGQLKMKHDKSHYQGMEVDGFKWQGFWDGYHHFVKKEAKGYLETRATDKDIEDGNLKDMIEYGVSKEHGGYMKKGGITGDLHSLTNQLLAQKIEIFIDKVKPIKYYFIDEDKNSLIVGLDENYTTGMAEKLYKEAKSSMEFFDADSIDMEYNSKTKDTQYIIKLKKPVKFEKGGYMEGGGGVGVDKHRIYFETLAEVIDAINNIANENGYEVVEYFPDITYGGIGYGETKKFKVELEWNGNDKAGKSKKREKNTLNVQIYRMDSGRYELNSYFAYEDGGYMEKGGEIITLWRISNGNAEQIKKGNASSINTFIKKEERKKWRGEKSVFDEGAGLESWFENTTKEDVLRHNRATRATDQQYANGGEITVKVGDRVRQRKKVGESVIYGIDGIVYETNGITFKLKDKYGNKSDKLYLTSSFKKSDIKSVANGGYMEKGGMTASQRLKARMKKSK